MKMKTEQEKISDATKIIFSNSDMKKYKHIMLWNKMLHKIDMDNVILIAS